MSIGMRALCLTRFAVGANVHATAHVPMLGQCIVATSPLCGGVRVGFGCVRAQKQVCVPKNRHQIWAPLIIIFFLRKIFLIGWLGQLGLAGAQTSAGPRVLKQWPGQ